MRAKSSMALLIAMIGLMVLIATFSTSSKPSLIATLSRTAPLSLVCRGELTPVDGGRRIPFSFYIRTNRAVDLESLPELVGELLQPPMGTLTPDLFDVRLRNCQQANGLASRIEIRIDAVGYHDELPADWEVQLQDAIVEAVRRRLAGPADVVQSLSMPQPSLWARLKAKLAAPPAAPVPMPAPAPKSPSIGKASVAA